MTTRLAAVIGTLAAAAVLAAPAAAKGPKSGLEFLGQAIVPTGTTFAGTTIGGLSSITYDRGRGVFYTLSDDQSQINPARFYTLHGSMSPTAHLDTATSFLGTGPPCSHPTGQPYVPTSARSRRTDAGEERRADRHLRGHRQPRHPSLGAVATRSAGRSSATCRFQSALRPENERHTRRAPEPRVRVRPRVAPDGRHLFVGMENALAQDGPAASVAGGSASRILR